MADTELLHTARLPQPSTAIQCGGGRGEGRCSGDGYARRDPIEVLLVENERNCRNSSSGGNLRSAITVPQSVNRNPLSLGRTLPDLTSMARPHALPLLAVLLALVMTWSWRSMMIVDERSYNYYQSDCAANSAYRFMGVFYFCFTFSALQPRAVVTNYISRDLGERGTGR
jgi:hypothetical protein